MNYQCIPIVVWTGTDWTITFYFTDDSGNPINISGYSAQMQGRITPNSSNPPVILASTGNGYITIVGVSGLLTITLPNAYTSLLPINTNGNWDLFIYSGSGVASRAAGGTFFIQESVTR